MALTITTVNISPNPVTTRQSFILAVEVQLTDTTYAELSSFTYEQLTTKTYAQLQTATPEEG